MNNQAKYTFSLLNKSIHDREKFDCGIDKINSYLKRVANQDAKLFLGRPHVLTDEDNKSEIIGFYTLSNYSIFVTDLPESYRKRLPDHRPIGATLLGMMGVDCKYQGQGIGELVFFDALYRSLKISRTGQASYAVVIDAINDSAKEFYKKYDAQEFPDHPMKLFIPMKKIERTFDIVSKNRNYQS